MILFYTPDIISNLYSLNEEESRHCRMVLRLREGDVIHLTDGKGTLFESRIIDIRSKRVMTEVIERQDNYGKRNFRLHMAVAPTKNTERFEWFLEKATEIGIDEITPLVCEHSERKNVRTDRLNKVITAALKQSLKAYHPRLNEPVPFKQFIQLPHTGTKFVAHLEENNPVLLQNEYKKGTDALILVGPEGDFSDKELEIAKIKGFHVVSLGTSRLRTETAAIVACHTVNLLNNS